ncbi:MAG: ABC transporter ATP-binding protein [Gammaproteobacteria bacterium]|nr:ABC transporter ATP-binding protein [Gammaproteobacteria bacterium]
MNRPVIKLQTVNKTYPMGDTTIKALRDVTLTVHEAEMVALVGPSGSGKSTLLNICGMLDQADSGEVSILQRDVAVMNARQRTLFRRDSLGFIFQSFNLIPVMSAYENVEYPLLLNRLPARQCHRQVQEILQRVGLEGMEHKLPDKLSGGQRQRVAVARALVKSPSLVIADEPTASLDTETAASIVEMMKSLARETGTSFLIATHDARMADHCERNIELRDGRIV